MNHNFSKDSKNKVWLMVLTAALFGILSCQKEADLTVNSKEELEEKLKSEFSDNDFPSISYSVVKNDKTLYSGALGFADEDNNIPATDNTRYLIASVSKTITGVAFMQLVDQNLVALDDDIDQFLPFSVRNPNYPDDKITFRMLLTHTSSICDDYQETFILDCYGVDCPMTLEQYFQETFVSTGQYYSTENFSNKKPGAHEEYSNIGLALIGYLVERIAQTPFDVYCKNNIFTPLGMNKTEWRLANTPLSELAIPYSPELDNLNPHYTFPDYPNGGLRTTVLDLSKFLSAVIQNGTLNGTQILSPTSMTEMKTPQFGSTEQCLVFYFDTINGRKILGHSGGEKGVTAEMYYSPSTNVGVIVFSNIEDADLSNIITLLFNYGEKQ